MRNVVILGSTGSIGRQALEVIEANPGRFRVVGLAAGGSHPELLADQVRRFKPDAVATGTESSTELASLVQADVVLNAITGAAGLYATLAALKAGKTLALANKESLVIGGQLVTQAAAPGQLVAVDSEHSAIAQALRSGRAEEVRKVILTASGGPFRGMTRKQLAKVTPEQAMHHPTWNMGRVITINSATLVNKGLELLEASLLYDVALDDIEVVVHPQSVVHSGVEFNDGATILQASPPDMKLPIGLALAWPERLADVAKPCDWRAATQWTFEPLDDVAFPAVNLARRAGKSGGTAPAVFNAANEVAVDAFCVGQIGFLAITDIIASVLDEHLRSVKTAPTLTVESVMAADDWARQSARRLIAGLQ